VRLVKGRENRLGLGYLRRYRVTIDFPHQRLLLAQGNQFADSDRDPICGLSFLFKPNRLEVMAVDEKGPARAAGILAKDVIVALDGKPVSKWKSSEIRELLASEGKTVQMTVERDGKRTEVSFTLREYD
jgi:S1-C subfamily serine protease